MMKLAAPQTPQMGMQRMAPLAAPQIAPQDPSLMQQFGSKVGTGLAAKQMGKMGLGAMDPTGGIASDAAVDLAAPAIGNIVGGWFADGGKVQQLCKEWAIGPDGNLFCVSYASGKLDPIKVEPKESMAEGMSDAERAVADIDKQRLWDKKAFANANARYGQEAVQDALAFGGAMGRPLSVDAAGVARWQNMGGNVKPMYQRMGGMTPGPLGMSDMLAAGKGKDVSKVTYKKKGGEIEDVMEISYHAPLAATPK